MHNNFTIRRKLVIINIFLTIIILCFQFLIQYQPSYAKVATDVGGPIIVDTTWTEGNSPYIAVDTVEIWEGVTLTIEPGVIIKFDNGKRLMVNGVLIAQGTSDNPIIFTSNQSIPEPGDWGNIEFAPSAPRTVMDVDGNYISGSILQYCTIEYAGQGVVIAVRAWAHLVDNCTVRYNDARPIHALGNSTYPSRVSNNTITQNTGDIGVQIRYGTAHGNTITGNTATAFGAGIFAELYSTVSENLISGNTADEHGGGVRAQGNSVVINNIIDGNKATNGAGIYASGSSRIEGNTISNNIAVNNGGGIYAQESEIISNYIHNNSAEELTPSGNRGGGIYADNCTINNNTIIYNRALFRGGGVVSFSSTVSNNIISNNSITFDSLGGGVMGGGIYAENRNLYSNTISGNEILYNNEMWTNGSGVHLVGTGEFNYNTVVGNTGPLDINLGGIGLEGVYDVHFNTIYGNQPLNVSVEVSDDIDGLNNYWGTSETVDITLSIYDWYDSDSLGKFNFVPFLDGPDPSSPIAPPLNLAWETQNSILLSWDFVHGEDENWSYLIYYDTDSGFPPYEGVGITEGDSSINVGHNDSYVLTGLDPCVDYYFAVTGRNEQDDDGWYSGYVIKEGDCPPTPTTTITPSDTPTTTITPSDTPTITISPSETPSPTVSPPGFINYLPLIVETN